jgi:hypothetical protein
VAIKDWLSPGENSNLLGALSPREHQLTSRIMQALTAIGVSENVGNFSGPFRYIGLVVPISLMAGLAIVAKQDLIKRLPISLIGMMAVIQFIYDAVVMNGWMRSWYFTGWYILMVFAVSFALSRVLSKLTVVQTTSLILAAMMTLLAVSVERNSEHWTIFANPSQLLVDVNVGNSVFVGDTPDRAVFFPASQSVNWKG